MKNKAQLGSELVEIDGISKIITAVWVTPEPTEGANWVVVQFDWERELITGLKMYYTRRLELYTIDVDNCINYVHNNWTTKNCTLINILPTKPNLENHLQLQ